MPIQLFTILYISEYREKSLSGYNVNNITSYTRFNKGDKVQKFNITVFYLIDKLKLCYIPKLEEEQVLSVFNSKFSKNKSGELDVSWLHFIIKIIFYQ